MTKPTSARDIEVPGPFDSGTEPFEDLPLAAKLALLRRRIGPGVKQHDVADTLIEAAIGSGVHRKAAIIDLLQGLGFNRGFVAVLLEKGAAAAAPRWRRDGRGRYRLPEGN